MKVVVKFGFVRTTVLAIGFLGLLAFCSIHYRTLQAFSPFQETPDKLFEAAFLLTDMADHLRGIQPVFDSAERLQTDPGFIEAGIERLQWAMKASVEQFDSLFDSQEDREWRDDIKAGLQDVFTTLIQEVLPAFQEGRLLSQDFLPVLQAHNTSYRNLLDDIENKIELLRLEHKKFTLKYFVVANRSLRTFTMAALFGGLWLVLLVFPFFRPFRVSLRSKTVICPQCLRCTHPFRSRYEGRQRYCEHCETRIISASAFKGVEIHFGDILADLGREIHIIANPDFEQKTEPIDVSAVFLDTRTCDSRLVEKFITYIVNHPPERGVQSVKIIYQGDIEHLDAHLTNALRNTFAHIDPIDGEGW